MERNLDLFSEEYIKSTLVYNQHTGITKEKSYYRTVMSFI